MPPQPMLSRDKIMFLSLRKNTGRILMKFAWDNHYHEQIKWLHFGRNWNRNKREAYSVPQKNVPSLACYRFNIRPPIFTIFGMSLAEIQKSAAGIIFSNLLTFTYFIMLWNEMTEMLRIRPTRHCCIFTRELCANVVFSVDNKVSIKSLYQFSSGLVQTCN